MMCDQISSKQHMALQCVVRTAIVYSGWRWFTKPKHDDDDKLVTRLFLFYLYLDVVRSYSTETPQSVSFSFAVYSSLVFKMKL
jgi:hypothetical protein